MLNTGNGIDFHFSQFSFYNKFILSSRYVVVKVDLQNEPKDSVTFTDQSLYACITKCVQKYYGELGVASIRFGFKCKYCNVQTRIAIIRIKHRLHRFVTSILPMASVVSKPAIIYY